MWQPEHFFYLSPREITFSSRSCGWPTSWACQVLSWDRDHIQFCTCYASLDERCRELPQRNIRNVFEIARELPQRTIRSVFEIVGKLPQRSSKTLPTPPHPVPCPRKAEKRADRTLFPPPPHPKPSNWRAQLLADRLLTLPATWFLWSSRWALSKALPIAMLWQGWPACMPCSTSVPSALCTFTVAIVAMETFSTPWRTTGSREPHRFFCLSIDYCIQTEGGDLTSPAPDKRRHLKQGLLKCVGVSATSTSDWGLLGWLNRNRMTTLVGAARIWPFHRCTHL